MALSGGALQGRSELGHSSKDRGGRLFIVLSAISVVLITLSVREGGEGPLSAIRGAFQFVTTPVRYIGVGLVSPLQGLGNVVANLTADQATLTELIAENEALKARNAELSEELRGSERLEDLLKLRSAYNLQSTGARIISQSTDSWTATVTIDKGTADGIAVGMPVTDSRGAIGQVIETAVNSSVVRLISDENSGVSAMVQSSRAQGVLEGSVDGTLRLNLIRTDQTVVVGDMVVTSGLGGVFPKGIPIGEVVSVERASGALYYDIAVNALSSLETYEEVLVITSVTEDQRATSEDILDADAQDSEVDRGGGTEPANGQAADGADAVSDSQDGQDGE